MTAPYRDENESLRAENERLRKELAERRRVKVGTTAALVGLDFVAIIALRPWLNGGSDVAFWGALAIILLIAALAVGSALLPRRA
jgi:hypothetical protein